MKIVIDLDEITSVGLAPNFVYRTLYVEHSDKLKKLHHKNLWAMATACDTAARQLYAQKTGRGQAVKSLILTYSDAEACFELFKQFAGVWALNA